MRVTILTPEFATTGGGIATLFRGVAPALRTAGVDVRIVEGSAFNVAPAPEAFSLDGISVTRLDRARMDGWWHRLPRFAATPPLRRHLAAAWAVWELAQEEGNLDVIEACDWGLLFVPPIVDGACPVVAQCQGSIGQIADHDALAGDDTGDALTRLIERDVLAHAAGVQTTSAANAAFWEREAGRTVDAIRPPWVTGAPKEVAVGRRGLVVGRVQRWKGPHILCEALALLGRSAPEIDWIGRDTPWERHGSSSADHLAAEFPAIWGARIHHQQPVEPGQVAERQAAALFNIVPSTWDVFNFAAIEAMASGRPTIVSDGAGASDLIDDGVNGHVFRAGDPADLAAAIDRVAKATPESRAEMGRRARETVRVAMSPRRIADARIAAYQAAIDAFRARGSGPLTGWVGDICRPVKAGGSDDMAHLDQHPLRSVLSYSARRIGRRMGLQ